MGWGDDRICSWHTFTGHETFLPFQLCKECNRYHFWVFRFLHFLRSNEPFYPRHRQQQKKFNICSNVTSFNHNRIPSNSIKLCAWTTSNRYSPFILKFLRFYFRAIKDRNIHWHCIQPALLATMVLLGLLRHVCYFKSRIVCGFFRA